MQHHSNNIVATAGILAIKNLNVFPSSGESDCLDYTVPWADSFREACRRSAILAGEAINSDHGYGKNWFTLLELSIPRFEVLGDGRYRLTGGIFLWAGHLFSPGATFRVHGNDFNIETPHLIEVGTAVPALMVEMHYDTYNASALSEISDDVLKELDIALDKSALPGDEDEVDVDDPDWMQAVKYISIYAATLTGGEPGRVIAYPIPDADRARYVPSPKVELDFDAEAFRAIDHWKPFDHFMVEFTNVKQQFAYITVELMGPPARAATGKDYDPEDYAMVDGFAELWSNANRDEYATHVPADVAETLRKIGAGEA